MNQYARGFFFPLERKQKLGIRVQLIGEETMWKWLDQCQQIINSLAGKEPPPPPLILPQPARRAAIAKALPAPLAVDPSESSLFYRLAEGGIECRSIASGEVRWQSQEDGCPLRVSDDILWVLQGEAIAAYSTQNGRLLMRSQPLWLPDGVHFVQLSDSSQQFLRIYSQYSPPPSGTPMPAEMLPPTEAAAYEIDLISGAVTVLYQVTIRWGGSRTPLDGDRRDDTDSFGRIIRSKIPFEGGLLQKDLSWKSLSTDEKHNLLQEYHDKVAEHDRQCREAYHNHSLELQAVRAQEYPQLQVRFQYHNESGQWLPIDQGQKHPQLSREQFLELGIDGPILKYAQLRTVSVIIHGHKSILLSVCPSQTPYTIQWTTPISRLHLDEPLRQRC